MHIKFYLSPNPSTSLLPLQWLNPSVSATCQGSCLTNQSWTVTREDCFTSPSNSGSPGRSICCLSPCGSSGCNHLGKQRTNEPGKETKNPCTKKYCIDGHEPQCSNPDVSCQSTQIWGWPITEIQSVPGIFGSRVLIWALYKNRGELHSSEIHPNFCSIWHCLALRFGFEPSSAYCMASELILGDMFFKPPICILLCVSS